jgi:hypothetical protein
MAEVTVCLFPESKPDSYNGLYRKTSELPKALEQIKEDKTPVLFFHNGHDKNTGQVNQKNIVGHVSNAFVGQDGVPRATVSLSRPKDVHEFYLFDMLEKGEIKGVSLGEEHYYDTDSVGRQIVTGHKVNELTFTARPDDPRCKIESFRLIKNDSVYNSNANLKGSVVIVCTFSDRSFISSSLNMTTSATPTPAAPAVDLAAELNELKRKLTEAETEKESLKKQKQELEPAAKAWQDKRAKEIEQSAADLEQMAPLIRKCILELMGTDKEGKDKANSEEYKNHPIVARLTGDGKDQPDYKSLAQDHNFMETAKLITVANAERNSFSAKEQEFQKKQQELNAKYEQAVKEKQELETRTRSSPSHEMPILNPQVVSSNTTTTTTTTTTNNAGAANGKDAEQKEWKPFFYQSGNKIIRPVDPNVFSGGAFAEQTNHPYFFGSQAPKPKPGMDRVMLKSTPYGNGNRRIGNAGEGFGRITFDDDPMSGDYMNHFTFFNSDKKVKLTRANANRS